MTVSAVPGSVALSKKASSHAWLAAYLLWCCTLPAAVAGQAVKAQLLARLQALRLQHDISAVGLAVVDLGSGPKRLDFSTGLGTLGHGRPEAVSAHTVFRLGSVTKSFTGLAALRLQQQGRLQLDTALTRHVDAGLWHNPWAGSAPVTLAQLLEHSAGFPGIGRAEFDSNQVLSLEAALRRFAPEHRVEWRPGLYTSYSNLGAGLVGLAMERATGVSYEDLIKRQVLQPLGMSRSGFEAGRVRVIGYDSDGRSPIPYWHVVYRPFGGLNASVSDMARYVRWHLEAGAGDSDALLPRGMLRRIEQPQTTLAARAGLEFGYGLGNYAWLRDGVLFHGHGGDADGYLSRFGYSHELGRGYFLVINAFNGTALGRMRAAVERALMDDFDVPEAPPAAAVDAEALGWAAGRYREQTWRFARPARTSGIELQLRAQGVRYREGSVWRYMVAVAAGPDRLLLRGSDENRPTAVLARLPDGSVHFVTDRLNLRKQEQ
ncbi:MAG: serine hydrolase domain-containing protein [Xanthomonadales bacterium]|nr:serine hydrolase domain-containing protein [Xanthomonadales bacterium]